MAEKGCKRVCGGNKLFDAKSEVRGQPLTGIQVQGFGAKQDPGCAYASFDAEGFWKSRTRCRRRYVGCRLCCVDLRERGACVRMCVYGWVWAMWMEV